MYLLGWALAIVGAALLLWSIAATVRSNSTTRIPYWTRPEVIPRGSLITRSLGVGLIIFGVVITISPGGYWISALVVLLFLPGLIMIPLHNRRVARSYPQ
ncbi:hypothetical protein [Salinibacterium sp. PAMC 21357]|uniref:hypothetical protein n=1 Tax=Salinibacterium sp. PAMC 21357 TaxID=1112215 RepID=UPI000289E8E7|nr:hypothetical protein [Salinibacterium sp. PAMC 21357]